MSALLSRIPILAGLFAFAIPASAQTVSVGTGASATATYGTTSQNFGPFPWTDLGITASAGVTPGELNVQTGGATSFTLNSTVTSGESFVAGSTVLNVGYTPGWTGSFASTPPAATGDLNSQFVYHIGPFNGSSTLLNVPLAIPGANDASLASSLNAAAVSPPVLASQSASGPGVSATVGIKAEACFIGCVTVASASVSFNLGSRIQQNVLATPTVTYGNMVWESTSQSYSPTAVFVAGSVGNVANTFQAPASLGLTNGQTFYYNFLPAVQLDMPVSNDAQVALPASITASYDIFGFGGSQTYPIGDLYSLNTGPESFNFNPTFYASDFYSIPLQYGAGSCTPGSDFCTLATYKVEGGGGNPVSTPIGGGVPSDSGPCGSSLINCMISVPAGSGTPGGYGDTPLGPLFPPADSSTGNVCGPADSLYPGQCINSITQTGVPEPDSLALLGLGFGLAGVNLVRRRRQR